MTRTKTESMNIIFDTLPRPELMASRKKIYYIPNQQRRWPYLHTSRAPHVKFQAARQAERATTYPNTADYLLHMNNNLWGKDDISAWKSLSGASKEWRSLPLSKVLSKSSPMTTSKYPPRYFRVPKRLSKCGGMPVSMLRKLGKPKPLLVPHRKPSKCYRLSMNASTWGEDTLREDAGFRDDFDRSAAGETYPLFIRNLTGTIVNSQIKLLYLKYNDEHSHTYTAKHIHKETIYDVKVYSFGGVGNKQKRRFKRDCAYSKKHSSFLDSWRQDGLVFLVFLVSEKTLLFDIEDTTAFPPLTACTELNSRSPSSDLS